MLERNLGAHDIEGIALGDRHKQFGVYTLQFSNYGVALS